MREKELALETYRSLLSLATEALRALLLLNGGAIVAMLGYLGQAEDPAQLAVRAGLPMKWFVTGLVATMSAFLFAYLCQNAMHSLDIEEPTKVPPSWWQLATVLACIAGLSCFGRGAFAAIAALSHA